MKYTKQEQGKVHKEQLIQRTKTNQQDYNRRYNYNKVHKKGTGKSSERKINTKNKNNPAGLK